MIKVGVIGVGNMGKHHARVYSKLKGCRLVGVCDIDEGQGKKIAEQYGCAYYKNYKEMLKQDIDAISIAVPTVFHREVALACINAGKHILVEKPIADTIESAREIINAAKKMRVKVAVGHVERFNPGVQRLKSMMKKGELGTITTILARRVGVFPPQIKDANVIIDLAVHDIDILNYLLGKTPTRIHAEAGKALINRREDYADILLKYDGINAFIQVNWITPIKIRSLAITGTKGYAELNYVTQEFMLYKSKYERNFETFEDVIKFAEPEIVKVRLRKSEPLKEELKNFISCIKLNKKPLVSGEDGLKALELAMEIVKSYGK
ncbi:MAG: Gfo/Idh/MocA family oxidoreductase [Candidatus Aenigmarchaeota archaeon]|nr:Gfo/Idh/MocA family oxidoreductase [Candidatus Aenigmarchaeota archaeon]